MGYIIFIILLLLLAVVGVLVGQSLKKKGVVEYRGNSTDYVRQGKITVYSSIAAFAVLFGLLTGISSYNAVPVGNVGLVYTFGNITGQTKSGLVWAAPWSSVKSANVKTQKYTFHLNAFSKETQDVFVDATLNYQVAPKDIQSLYRTVGATWFDILVPTRVNQAFKDETVKFKAVEIAPNRDVIRSDVLQRLKNGLKQFSIQVDDLNIDNISFSPAFTKAIEDKQIATQEAAAAQNRVAQAQAQASALIKTAQGIAESNKLKQRTLTPLLVQQSAIDKLNPNVKVVVVDSKSILNLGNLFGSTP